MKNVVRLLGVACVLTLTSPTLAQERPSKEVVRMINACRLASTPQERVDACTRALDLPRIPEGIATAIKEERGMNLVELEKYQEALADLVSASSPRPLNARTIAYLETGQYEEAFADATEFVRLVPDNAGAHNLRAWVCVKAGQATEGLADVNRAIELKPDFAEAYDTRAHIYEAMAKDPTVQEDPNEVSEVSKMLTAPEYIDKAVEDYRKALELKPDLQESIDGLKRMNIGK